MAEILDFLDKRVTKIEGEYGNMLEVSEYTPEETADKYYIYDIGFEEDTGPVVNASDNLNYWFSQDSTDAKAPYHLKNYTLVAWDGVRYFLNNSENRWVGKITVVDKSKEYARQPEEPDYLKDFSGGWSTVEDIPDFDKQDSFWKNTWYEPTVVPDAKILRTIGKPTRGVEYWIDLSKMLTVGPSDFQESNSLVVKDVILDNAEDLESLDRSTPWRDSPDNTIYQDTLNYYVHVNSYKKTIPLESQDADRKKFFRQFVINAVEVLADKQHRNISQANAESIANYLVKLPRKDVFTTSIKPRPNSFWKALVKIPRAYIDPYEIVPKVQSTHVGVFRSWHDLEESYKKVIKYFNKLIPLVEQNTVRLDMKQEIKFLEKVWTNLASIKQAPVLQEGTIRYYGAKQPSNIQITDDTIVKFAFNRRNNFSLENIEIVNQMEGSGVVSITERILRAMIDLNKSGIKNNDVFKRARTMIYLMNLDLMARDIDDKAFGGENKWIDFLFKYTYKMPDFLPSNTDFDKINFQNNEVTSFLNKIDRALDGPKTLFSNNKIMREISPDVRGLLADVKKSVYSKIEDPTLQKIFQTIDGVNSLESLYSDVLNKAPIDKLIEMGRQVADPIAKQQMFMKKSSLLKSQARLSEGRLENLRGKKSLRKVQVTTPQEKAITDLTGQQPDMIMKAIEELFVEGLCNNIKHIIKTIRRMAFSPTTTQDTKDFGKLNIQDTVKESQDEIIKNILNSIPEGKDLDLFDVKKILTIISENCIPREIVALVEGEASLPVLEILGYLIGYEFPILGARLDSVYDIEEFLALILKPLREQIIQATAKIELDRKDEEEKATYCAPDYEEVTNHLVDRFPEDIARAAMDGEKSSKIDFLNLLNDIDSALNKDINEFIFGNKLDSILNQIMTEDQGSSFLTSMVIESFFSPFIRNFSIEGLNISTFFLEPQLVDKNPSDTTSRTVSPPEITSRIGELTAERDSLVLKRDSLDKDDNKAQRKKLKEQIDNINSFLEATTNSKKVVLGLKNRVQFLKDVFAEGVGTWTRTSTDPITYILSIPLTQEDEAGTSSFIEMKIYPMEEVYQIDPDKPLAYDASWKKPGNFQEKDSVRIEIRAVITDTVVVESSSIINTRELSIYDFISNDDTGHTIQASAFSNIIKAQIKDYFPDYIWTEGLGEEEELDVGNAYKLQQLINDFKSYLFDLLNQQLLKLVSKEASKSSFFKESVLSQLRIASLPGDAEAGPPPLCGEEYSEEVVPPADRSLFPELFDLDDIVENVKTRKTYFDVLAATGHTGGVPNRSSLDNAIIFESLELLMQVICLEFLLSGISIYGEVSLETFIKEKNNFKILQDVLDFSLESLGGDFTGAFYNVVDEYATLRQEVAFEASVMPPMPLFAPATPDGSITPSVRDEIVKFCLTEALEEIFPIFQSIVQVFSASDKLSANELLDIVPNMDTAPQTISNTVRFDFNDEKIKDVYDFGGIVVEKYIKAIYTPPAGLEDKSWYHPAHSALHKMLIIDPQTPSSYVQDESGQWIEKEGSPVSAARNIKIEEWLASRNQELNLNQNPPYMAGVSWESKKKAERLKSWLDIFSEQGLEGIEKLNIAGYQEFVIELNAFDYSSLKNNEFYPIGGKTGVVNLKSFELLQQQINDYNAPFIEESQDKLDLLTSASTFKNNFLALKQEKELHLLTLETLGAQLDEYLMDYLNTFRDDGANKGKEYIVQHGTFTFDAEPSMDEDPRIFSDKVIFEWISGDSPYYHSLTKILEGGPVQKNTEEWWGLEYPGYELAQKYWTAVLAMTGLQQNAWLVSGYDMDTVTNLFKAQMESYLKGDKYMAENDPFLFGHVKKLQQFFFLNPLFGKMISTLVGGAYYSDYTGFENSTAAGDLFDPAGILGGISSLIQAVDNQGTEAYTDDLEQGGMAETTSVSTSYYDGLIEYYENRIDPIWRKWSETLHYLLNPPEAALEKFNYWDTQKKITEKRIEWFEKNMEAMKTIYTQFLSAQQAVLTTSQAMSSLLAEAEVNFESDIDDSSRAYELYTDPTQWFENAEFIRQYLLDKAEKEKNNNVIMGDYKKYFGSLKYGIRISYVFPNFEDISVPFGLQHKLQAILPSLSEDKARLAEIKENLNELFNEPTHSRNIFHKAFKLEEKLLSNTGVQTTKINLLPLVTYEEDIDNFLFSDEEQTGPTVLEGLSVPIENMDISNEKSFPFKELKQSLMETPGYRGIFGECMYYGELINCLGLFSSLVILKDFYNTSQSGIFSGTKINLKNIMEGVMEQRDFRAKSADLTPLEKMKNNFLSLSNVAENPRGEGKDPPNKSGYAAVFAAKTALKILKGVVETTDPAIIQGKKLQSALVGAINASKDISQTLAQITGNEIPSSDSDSFSQAEKTLVNDAMLGPVVFIGVRPFPPIPFPVGNPIFPLTAAGATYLALTTAMSLGDLTGEKKSKAEKDEPYCVEG